MADTGEAGQGAGAASTAGSVFISYASADKAAADAICASLEQGGIACWIAPRNVTPGVFYADAIVEAINASRILIMVLSANSAGSQHVLREVERASSKRKPLIAFRLDTTPLPTGLEYFLSASHWLDASGVSVERSLPGLGEAVRRLLTPVANPPTFPIGHDADNIGQNRTPSAPLAAPKFRSALFWIVGAVAASALALLAGQSIRSRKFEPSAAVPLAAVTAPIIAVSPTPAPDKSVAVLPFADMSEKKDQEFLSDGMAEEIIDLLVKIPDLRVPARTSSFYFKDKPSKIPDIARELGVANVLEGSVRL